MTSCCMENIMQKIQKKIVLTINSLQNRTSRLEGLFLGIKNEWPSYYLHVGIEYSVFSYQLQLYLLECPERHNRLYEALLNSLQNVLNGIATLSKGYLPVKLPPPSKLRQISETTLKRYKNLSLIRLWQ